MHGNLPDKIDYENKKYKDLFTISSEDIEHIKTMYKDLLYKEIDEASYNREKKCVIEIQDEKYETNKNILVLSKEQTINLAIKILQNLKEDSITLNLIANKIKTISPDSEYANINKINEEIQKYIEELEKQEKNSEEYIKIEVYDYNGKTIRCDLYVKQERKLRLDYIVKNGEEIIYINQLFTKNESGAIIYDIETSLLGANNITITKRNDGLKVDICLYNVKEIYRTILDEMRAKFKEQENNIQSNENDINNITQEEINEIEKIYNQYEKTSKKLLEIGICIEIKQNSENNEEISLYTNICNSKIGAKLNVEKTYTEDIGDIPTIDEKNTVILNKHSKEQIEGVVKIISTKIINTIKQRIK